MTHLPAKWATSCSRLAPASLQARRRRIAGYLPSCEAVDVPTTIDIGTAMAMLANDIEIAIFLQQRRLRQRARASMVLGSLVGIPMCL
jgi:hypothetical protein